MDPFTSRKLTTLRFLAVASVVVYHAYPFAPGVFIVAPPPTDSAAGFIEGFVSLALMRWALPFLGLVSGYLFFRTFSPTLEGYLAKLRSRARTLLVPFLIWSGAGVLFSLSITVSPLAGVSPYWTITSVPEALDRWLLHPVIYPLWFLQALLACMVLSPLVYVAVRALRGWVLVLAAAWWAVGWQPEAMWPWVSATAFPPFIAGAAVALLGWRMPSRWAHGGAPAWLAAALAAAWLAGAALFTAYGDDMGRWTRAGLLPVVVFGICVAWTVPDVLRRRAASAPGPIRPAASAAGPTRPAAAEATRRGRWNVLAAAALSVAPLSFFVYVTQEPALAVCKRVAESAAGGGAPQLLAYAAPPLVVIALAVAAGIALRRLAPRAFGVATGGRGRGHAGGKATPGASPGPAPAPAPALAPGPAPAPAPRRSDAPPGAEPG
jgi:peptidoglycan/LPS O-acetylase OafA/YrhL